MTVDTARRVDPPSPRGQERRRAPAQAEAGARAPGNRSIDRIRADSIVRDRAGLDPEAMAELLAFARAGGVRVPVEATPIGDGARGPISGDWRLRAVRAPRGGRHRARARARRGRPHRAPRAHGRGERDTLAAHARRARADRGGRGRAGCVPRHRGRGGPDLRLGERGRALRGPRLRGRPRRAGRPAARRPPIRASAAACGAVSWRDAAGRRQARGDADLAMAREPSAPHGRAARRSRGGAGSPDGSRARRRPSTGRAAGGPAPVPAASGGSAGPPCRRVWRPSARARSLARRRRTRSACPMIRPPSANARGPAP